MLGGKDVDPYPATDHGVNETVADTGGHHLAVGARSGRVNPVPVVTTKSQHQLLAETLLRLGGHLASVDDVFTWLPWTKAQHHFINECGDARWNALRIQVTGLVPRRGEDPGRQVRGSSTADGPSTLALFRNS